MHAFTGPQPVEVHHRGIWYSGELLGWRHEPWGRVSARVRCRVDGLRHTTWKDLTELRLPDPRHPPRTDARSAALGRPAPDDRLDDRFADDDRTRPHVLRAAPGARPAKPAHAASPPTPQHPPAATPAPSVAGWTPESARPLVATTAGTA
jgi:hypothetical protein